MLKIDILTIFPKMFKGPFSESIVGRAQEKKLVEINIHDLRKWTGDKRKTVDDRPFGGGVGMIMMIEPIYRALQELKSASRRTKVILLTPQGKTFNQSTARRIRQLAGEGEFFLFFLFSFSMCLFYHYPKQF